MKSVYELALLKSIDVLIVENRTLKTQLELASEQIISAHEQLELLSEEYLKREGDLRKENVELKEDIQEFQHDLINNEAIIKQLEAQLEITRLELEKWDQWHKNLNESIQAAHKEDMTKIAMLIKEITGE